MAEHEAPWTCACGGAMSANPHPEAGEPSKVNEVGATYECVPCLVRTRNRWASRAMKAERELKDAMTTTGAIVAACGGQVRVPECLLVDGPKVLERRDDPVSGQVVFDAH